MRYALAFLHLSSKGDEMRHRGSATMGGVVLLTVLLLFAATAISAQSDYKPAPPFKLKDLVGEEVALKDLVGGGPILISFWATWCKPCLKELPHLQKLYEEFGERGLKLLAISLDSPRSLSKVRSFIKGYRYTFTVLLDPNKKVSRKFMVRAIPYTFLLNPQGEIVYSRAYRPGVEETLRKMVMEMVPAEVDTSGHDVSPFHIDPSSDEGSPDESHSGGDR